MSEGRRIKDAAGAACLGVAIAVLGYALLVNGHDLGEVLLVFGGATAVLSLGWIGVTLIRQ